MKQSGNERRYREYIESDESLKMLLNAEDVDMTMPSPNDRESRVTVRLNGDDIELIDKMCDILGVGRSTFLRMAARIVAISSLKGMKESSLPPFFEAAATTDLIDNDDKRKPA